MWLKVENEETATLFLGVMQASDPVSYDPKDDKRGVASQIKDILTSESWFYDDGSGQCAIMVQEKKKDDEPYLEYLAYCSIGFGGTPFDNWGIAYKIMCSKCRELKEEKGIIKSGGYVPMTETGKCIAYYAQEIAWEQDELSVTASGNAWRLEFVRDAARKPEDETRFEKVKEPTVIPDSKPK